MKHILITGASSGIGLSLTKELQKKSQIIAIARDFSKVDYLPHPNVKTHSIDLRDLSVLEKSLKSLTKNPVDTLILSAGIGHFKHLEELSYAQITEMMNTNFISHSFIVKAFLPILKKRKNAHIIFIGSTAALNGEKMGTIYCASKFALRGFCQALRKEIQNSSIKVSIIQPGMVNTAFYSNLHFSPKEDELCSLNSSDIVDAVKLILTLPKRAVVDEIVISPKKFGLSFKNKNKL